MAQALQSCLYFLGLLAIMFGLLGWNAILQGWGDKDVTRRDYGVYGTVALCLGGLLVYFGTKVA